MTADEQRAAVDEAERLHGLATKGPWEYRPNRFDDWGVVRNDAGYYVLQARDGGATSADDHDTHRAAGTDPYAPNALSTAALHNIAGVLFAAYRERERLRKALREIAKQELSADMSVDDQLGGDFEGAYDHMIEIARAALSTEER